jgi:hypothetical protein
MADKLTPRDLLAAWLVREGHTKTWAAAKLDARPEYLSRWLGGIAPSEEIREKIRKLTGGDVPAEGKWV